MFSQQNIRLSLPSKGRLEIDALDFLSDAGLTDLQTKSAPISSGNACPA